jgi:hypothetical protein
MRGWLPPRLLVCFQAHAAERMSGLEKLVGWPLIVPGDDLQARRGFGYVRLGDRSVTDSAVDDHESFPWNEKSRPAPRDCSAQ